MTTLEHILTDATPRQQKQIANAVGMAIDSLGQRSAEHTAPWIKVEIAKALGKPVDELFGPNR